MPCMPVASPRMLGLYVRLRDTHAISSPRRRMPRPKLKPQSAVEGSNGSDLNGIAISATQPVSSMLAAVSQITVQSLWNELMFW
jgi:hypothetical protein